MPDPKNPNDMPTPAPTWKPPVEEPDDGEQLPDEKRDPNPDENREPPMRMGGTPKPSRSPTVTRRGRARPAWLPAQPTSRKVSCDGNPA